MISIIRANLEHKIILTDLGRITFIETHGRSASQEDIENYVNLNYTLGILENELKNPSNIYHILYYNQKPVGYSKINLNVTNEQINVVQVTKLDRIYFLKEFYGLQLGKLLFDFNVKYAKSMSQKGMWLYVWTENERAIKFYLKNGFKINGSYNFKISPTHSNPNHLMFLQF